MLHKSPISRTAQVIEGAFVWRFKIMITISIELNQSDENKYEIFFSDNYHIK